MTMLTEHDQDVQARCRRLGQEVVFGYCRQETDGKPCRWVLDCWWERFDVRSFLQSHLSEEVMAQVERGGASPPASKVVSLLDLVQQARERLALAQREDGKQRKP
jgi:hypothetical protein